MDEIINIKKIREQIDIIDNKLLELFVERMKLVSRVVEYKKQNGLPILDSAREAEKITDITDRLSDLYGDMDLMKEIFGFFDNILKISREYQKKLIGGENDENTGD